MPADKKRQRADGRNYRIEVDRPRVVEEYQNNMGYVDRHNRYRQNILGLYELRVNRVGSYGVWWPRMTIDPIKLAKKVV